MEVGKRTFQEYEKQFKALADQRRLEIMYELSERGQTCVCDLTEFFGVSQSKLSYHLKVLLGANLIVKETKGTWSYYDINEKQVKGLLSEELCCVFERTGNKATSNTCC